MRDKLSKQIIQDLAWKDSIRLDGQVLKESDQIDYKNHLLEMKKQCDEYM